MNYRRLGTTDIEVSEVSLGCWTMGGLNYVDGKANGWANVNESDIAKAIQTAVDAGVNHFDNADVYGNGDAERMLASVLKTLGLKSEQFVFATKVGHFKGTAKHAYEPLHIRRQCEQSLKNLGRETIDIYYLHHGNFGPNDEYLEGAAETMRNLRDEGKIRLIGQSAYQSSDFERIVPIVKPTVLQSWAHAMDTKFIQPTSIVGQLLAKNQLSFVAFSPLNQGLLLDKFDPENPPLFEAGDHRRNQPKFSKESLRKLKPKMEQIKDRFGESAPELAGVALRYVLKHPNVACVIPGFRNERQVANNLITIDRQLSEADIKFIKSLFESK